MRPDIRAILCLVLAPLLLLAPSVFGSRTYVPFDLAQYPPLATSLDAEELAAIHSQPANMDISELPITVIPEIELAGDELRSGRLPLWNPYARFGGPLLGNGLDGLLYPPNLLLLLSSEPQEWLGFMAWLAFAIGGILMYGLLRELALGPTASLFGALVFALSGTLTANAPFYMRLNALIWLPGMLHACLLIARQKGRDRIPASCGLSICLGMSWLAGFPPFALLASLLCAAWAALQCLRLGLRAGFSAAARLAGWILAAGMVGLALSAAQLLPTLEYSLASFRGQGQSANSLASQAFDPAGLLGFLMPQVFGDPGQGSMPPYDRSPLVHLLFSRASWTAETNAAGLSIRAGTPFFPQRYNFTEYTIFIGVLPLLLAALGATRRTAFRWPALLLLLAFGTLACAPSWLSWIYAMPGLNTVAPQRYMAALAPLIALLAASGCQRLEQKPGPRWWLFPACGLALAGLALWLASWAGGDQPLHERSDQIGQITERFAGRRPGSELTDLRPIAEARFADQLESSNQRLVDSLDRAAWVLLLASLLLAAWPLARRREFWLRVLLAITVLAAVTELLLFAYPLNGGRVLQQPRSSPVHDFLRQQRDLYREDGGFSLARASGSGHGTPVDLPIGQLYRERIRDLNAYAFVDAWSQRIFAALFSDENLRSGIWPMNFPDVEALGRPALDLLGLRFLLASEALEHGGQRVGPELPGARGQSFYIYERPNPLARAFYVPELRLLPDEDQVLAAMVPNLQHAEEFDPLAAVLLTPGQARLLDPLEDAEPGSGSKTRRIRFLQDDPEDLRIRVDPGPPGYLVLADAALPGWQASCNGEPRAFARGNLFMRVLPIPGEAVEVRYSYRAPGLGMGLLLSTAALICLIAGAWQYLNSRRSGHQVEVTD